MVKPLAISLSGMGKGLEAEMVEAIKSIYNCKAIQNCHKESPHTTKIS
jgi:hypothetical protein